MGTFYHKSAVQNNEESVNIYDSMEGYVLVHTIGDDVDYKTFASFPEALTAFSEIASRLEVKKMMDDKVYKIVEDKKR